MIFMQITPLGHKPRLEFLQHGGHVQLKPRDICFSNSLAYCKFARKYTCCANLLTHPKYVIKYVKLSYFDQMSNNKTAVHIRLWRVSAQAHIQNMQMAATSAQIHWHMLNLAMDSCNMHIFLQI